VNAPSVNQHGVAIAVETVAFFDGPSVGVEDRVSSRKRRDEKEKRRLGQMEIRDQSIDGLEVMAWPNEKVGLAGPGFQPAARGYALQGANRCGAHRDDPMTPLTRAGIGLRGFFGDVKSFGQDSMILDVFSVHAGEGSGADVEHDLANDDSIGPKAAEQAFREVEARSRSGNASRLLRVHGLVPLPIEGAGRAADVWRQWQVTDFLKQVQDADIGLETHRAFAVLVNRDHATGGAVVEGDQRSHTQFPAGPDEGSKLVGVRRFWKKVKNLGPTTSAGAAQKASGKHAAAVEYEEIAGAQVLREIRKCVVAERRGWAVKDEEPGRISSRDRFLRDEFGRQVEIEVLRLQKSFF
jgi:hypothetical protein